MIAGEHSGDSLGASLMQGLKQHGITDIQGIGGEHMIDEGLESIIPLEELCVMGIWEVIGQLPRLLKLINATVEEIERLKPDIVVTIDFPDFNFQVSQRLRKRGNYKGKIVHYGAPTVWAWRPDRAKKVAEYLDGMMCLFPFEPPYFEKHGLRSEYVGHPITQIDRNAADGKLFKQRRNIDQDTYCIGLFLGSREAEISTCGDAFVETINALHEKNPNIQIIVPTLSELEYDVSQKLKDCRATKHMVVKDEAKWNAFAACDIAMAVSGTVGLELSYMNIPHIIGYKTNPITAAIARQIVKLKYINLTNILLDRQVVPEFLQGQCNASTLSRAMIRLMIHPEDVAEQKKSFVELRELLKLENDDASCRASKFVLDVCDNINRNDKAA